MADCKKCGASFDVENATFCPICGKKIVSKRNQAKLTNLEYINAVGKKAALNVLTEIEGKTPEAGTEYLFSQRDKIPVVYYVSLSWCERRVYTDGTERSHNRKYRFFAEDGYQRENCLLPDMNTKYRTEYSSVKATVGETTIKKSMNPKDFGVSIFWTKEEAIYEAAGYGWPVSSD